MSGLAVKGFEVGQVEDFTPLPAVALPREGGSGFSTLRPNIVGARINPHLPPESTIRRCLHRSLTVSDQTSYLGVTSHLY